MSRSQSFKKKKKRNTKISDTSTDVHNTSTLGRQIATERTTSEKRESERSGQFLLPNIESGPNLEDSSSSTLAFIKTTRNFLRRNSGTVLCSNILPNISVQKKKRDRTRYYEVFGYL